MKSNAIKGAIFSGLVFPGVGQLILKCYLRGIALILAVLVSVAVIVAIASQHALNILDKIMMEGGPIDLGTIYEASEQSASAADGFAVNIAFLVILACWIAGTIDAYIVGKKLDKDEQKQ